MAPTVSVIIPTFNRSNLLLRALESVFAQTWRNYEVIVVDDGSTDDTWKKLRPYMGKIHYSFQGNRGVSRARNAGLWDARGEWVAMLDSDDEWLPTKLERQMEAVNTLGEEVGACFTDCRFVGDPNLQQTAFEMAGIAKSEKLAMFPDLVPWVLSVIDGKGWSPFIWVQSLLIRRACLRAVGGFDEAMTVMEDTDLIGRLSTRIGFCSVSEVLVKIDRSQSRSGLMTLWDERDDRVALSQCRLYRNWLESPLGRLPQVRQYLLDKGLLRNAYCGWIIRQLNQGKWRDALRSLNELSSFTRHNQSHVLWILTQRLARKLCKA